MPHFRERRSGHIFNLSSIGGLIGSPGWGFYNATKFAVEGYNEALAGEMKPLGVHVTAIEPVRFASISGSLRKAWGQRIARIQGDCRQVTHLSADAVAEAAWGPQKEVDAILQVANAPEPPLHLILGKIAYQRFRDKLKAWDVELKAWKAVTLGADFPEGQ